MKSRGLSKKCGSMHSRAALSPCSRYLFEGEYENMESETRSTVVTVKDWISGKVVGRLSYSH